MNSAITDLTIIQMLMLSPARLEMYYTFDQADVFTGSASDSYLRDKSPKENHILLADNTVLTYSSTSSSWQFNSQKVLELPGVAFREAITFVYWVYLSGSTVEIATIKFGAGATEAIIKIQHIYSSGSFSTSLNSVSKSTQSIFSGSAQL